MKKQWQYLVEYISRTAPVDLQRRLNYLGFDGWELVEIRWHEHEEINYCPMAIFKRETI